MAAVAGLRGSGDWATDERPKNFREFILWRNPNGMAPIFALMARVQKESTDDPEFSWWDEPMDLVRLQVNGALGAGDTTVVVDSSDPSSTAPGNRWGVATHLKPGDLLLVEPAADNATYDHEIVEVESVTSTTQFVVKRGKAGTTAAAIADNLFLLLLGSAYEEGSAEPKASSRNPIKYTNYTQIFKDAYDISRTAAATRTRTGDPVRNDKKRKSFDHARGIEQALLWGQKSEANGPNGKPIRTMDGIRSFMPTATTTVFSTTTTVSTFLDAVYPVFDFDSPAGDERIGFCGNNGLNILNKMIQTDSNTQVQFGGVVSQFGMNFREFLMPQGRLLMRTHPLLNRNTLYRDSMFIIDFSSLRWRPLRGGDTKFQDNIQNKGEDARRGQWLTEAGLEVRYGGLTNGYLGAIQ
ncbi:hypothetical protein CMI37_11415 [Candidatus Pacearchaeota archaeon]|nr:hypothetical protein [Candidatus Pacearchaeota archaeon]